MKIYLVSSISLPWVPKHHRSGNGSCQFLALVRTTSQKRVAELCNTGLSGLVTMGLRPAPPELGYKERVRVADIVKKDETIYYLVGHTATAYLNRWFEYRPKS